MAVGRLTAAILSRAKRGEERQPSQAVNSKRSEEFDGPVNGIVKRPVHTLLLNGMTINERIVNILHNQLSGTVE